MATKTRRAARYKATFQQSISGAVLVRLARSGRKIDLRGTVPAEVIDYLCLKRTNAGTLVFDVDGHREWADLLACTDVVERVRKDAPRKATIEFTVEPAGAEYTPADPSLAAEPLPRTWNDGAHCGLTDWYEPLEAAITAALDRGKGYAWTTGWYASKKEIASACITHRDGEIAVEVSVSDDFDGSGLGWKTIRFTTDLDRIRAAIDAAWQAAEGDQRDNRCYAGFSVGRGEKWEYTLVLPHGDGCFMDEPPGDNYHRWGWQEVEDGEERPAEIPAEVAAKLLAWAEKNTYATAANRTIGGWTIRAWE